MASWINTALLVSFARRVPVRHLGHHCCQFQTLTVQLLACRVEVKDYTCDPIGLCLAPLAGRLNHSCTPNAFVAFPYGTHVPDSLRVIARSDINPGEEITVSYVDLGLPLYKRTDVLSTFGIQHARCEHCVEVQSDIRWMGRHGCAGDGLVPIRGELTTLLDHAVPLPARRRRRSAQRLEQSALQVYRQIGASIWLARQRIRPLPRLLEHRRIHRDHDPHLLPRRQAL